MAVHPSSLQSSEGCVCVYVCARVTEELSYAPNPSRDSRAYQNRIIGTGKLAEPHPEKRVEMSLCYRMNLPWTENLHFGDPLSGPRRLVGPDLKHSPAPRETHLYIVLGKRGVKSNQGMVGERSHLAKPLNHKRLASLALLRRGTGPGSAPWWQSGVNRRSMPSQISALCLWCA